MVIKSKGRLLKDLSRSEKPLIMMGTPNPLCALIAQHSQAKAIYLSGAGVANIDLGLPDLGLTSLDNVVQICRRITDVCDLPLLVDADTGWGGVLNVQQTVTQLCNAGAAGLHIEDQQYPKRCGHRDNKKLISSQEMCEKLAAAVDSRPDKDFVIMARTDAIAVENLDSALQRSKQYVAAGADMVFVEAVTELEHYRLFTKELGQTPVLANITEFGKTPLFTQEQLAEMEVSIMLFPLTAMRAMNFAVAKAYATIIQTGTQAPLMQQLQSRDGLYKLLDYFTYESKIDNEQKE